MILDGVEDCDEHPDGALGVGCFGGGGGEGGGVAAGEEGAGEVADGGYDHGEVVAAVPKAIVGGLIAEDLSIGNTLAGGRRWEVERMRVERDVRA